LLQPEAGLFSKHCTTAGYGPAEINAVALTHIHADHSGGLMQHGKQVFPSATVFVPELAYNYNGHESGNKST
jgi:metal-dependent hydrolase (beta-lactamase superfamily II)